jgi:hypothetical protein
LARSTNDRYLAVGGMKRCTICELMKPVAGFYKRTASKDGYRNDCRDCISNRGREYYGNNAETRRKYSRDWAKNNPDLVAQRRREYYERKGKAQQRIKRAALTSEERKQYNADRRADRAADPERFQRYDVHRKMRQYGHTVETYDALLAEQGGSCAVCGGPPAGKAGAAGGRFHIDHDHVTGELRGLLCHFCNTGLGSLFDDVERLERAISYLRAPPASRLGSAPEPEPE